MKKIFPLLLFLVSCKTQPEVYSGIRLNQPISNDILKEFTYSNGWYFKELGYNSFSRMRYSTTNDIVTTVSVEFGRYFTGEFYNSCSKEDFEKIYSSLVAKYGKEYSMNYGIEEYANQRLYWWELSDFIIMATYDTSSGKNSVYYDLDDRNKNLINNRLDKKNYNL